MTRAVAIAVVGLTQAVAMITSSRLKTVQVAGAAQEAVGIGNKLSDPAGKGLTMVRSVIRRDEVLVVASDLQTATLRPGTSPAGAVSTCSAIR